MTDELRPRSPAAASASRRNGARSTGPGSVAGKASSSQNAVKHGLFRAQPFEPYELSPELARLAATLEGLAAARYEAEMHVEMACLAHVRLEAATRLVDQLRDELTVILVAGRGDAGRLDDLLEQLVRVSRYQRRFRGQRDRALRALLKAAPAQASPHQPRQA